MTKVNKANLSVTMYLDKIRKSENGYMMFSVHFNKSRAKISSKIKIPVKYWNKTKAEIKNSYPLKKQVDKKLKEIETAIFELLYDLEEIGYDPTSKMLKEKVTTIFHKNKASDFFIELQKFIDHRKNSENFRKGTAKSYIPLIRLCKLYEYENGNISFRNINKDFMETFWNFLIKQPDIYNSYAKKQFSNLKSFLNDCYKNGYLRDAMYREYTPDKSASYSTKVDLRLNKSELKLIEDYIPETQRLTKTKDSFLLQCYTGLRVSDLMKLSIENINLNNNEILVITEKTTKPARIPILNKTMAILEKYDFNLPRYADQVFNRNIKDLCKLAGLDQPIQIKKYKGANTITEYYAKWELMTSNVARKTFITGALELGLNDFEVMEITGHTKRETLSKYVKIASNDAMEKARKVLNNL